MKLGIYKNNKSGNEYLLMDFGTYRSTIKVNSRVGIVTDATNSADGKVRDLYYDGKEYSVLVDSDDPLIGRTFLIYHRQDEFPVKDYFIREVSEFVEKFTFDREY